MFNSSKKEILKTKNDEFNIGILKTENWGKSKNKNFLPLVTMKKPLRYQFDKSVGFLIKNPRERTKNI